MLDLDMRKKNLNRWNILGAFFFFFFVLCFFIHRLNFPIPRSQHIHCVETYIDYLTLCMLKVLISPDQHIQFVEEWGYVKSKTSLNVPCMEQQSERTSKQKWQSECFVSMQTSLFVFLFFLRLLFLNLGQRRWLPLLFFSFFFHVGVGSSKCCQFPHSTFRDTEKTDGAPHFGRANWYQLACPKIGSMVGQGVNVYLSGIFWEKQGSVPMNLIMVKPKPCDSSQGLYKFILTQCHKDPIQTCWLVKSACLKWRESFIFDVSVHLQCSDCWKSACLRWTFFRQGVEVYSWGLIWMFKMRGYTLKTWPSACWTFQLVAVDTSVDKQGQVWEEPCGMTNGWEGKKCFICSKQQDFFYFLSRTWVALGWAWKLVKIGRFNPAPGKANFDWNPMASWRYGENRTAMFGLYRGTDFLFSSSFL